jgi:hypothetical protein
LESDKVGDLSKVKIVALAARWTVALSEAGISEIEKQTGIDRENWEAELEKVAKEIEKAAEELEKATEKVGTDD